MVAVEHVQVIPCIELEDDDAEPAPLGVQPHGDGSLFDVRDLVGMIPAVGDYVMEVCLEGRAYFAAQAGYTFRAEGMDDFFGVGFVSTHLKWEWAFGRIAGTNEIDWDDFGGGGFRYGMRRSGDELEISHSRGRGFRCGCAAFLAEARRAVAAMGSFKRELFGYLEPRLADAPEALGTLRRDFWEMP